VIKFAGIKAELTSRSPNGECPTAAAAKVIAQIDFDAEFVRPLLNRLDYVFVRHTLEFRPMLHTVAGLW
jgi:hypothetical protein